jgi:hypothetical protein
LRTSAIIITHASLPPVTLISDYWTHLDTITSVITFPISVWFPALFPASALIVVLSLFTSVLTLFLFCYLSVPE